MAVGQRENLLMDSSAESTQPTMRTERSSTANMIMEDTTSSRELKRPRTSGSAMSRDQLKNPISDEKFQIEKRLFDSSINRDEG